MRLRKKKHLDERLEQVGKYLLAREEFDFYINKDKLQLGEFNLSSIFGNNNPVYLELGCGKGAFAVGMAKMLPNINFVAVEKLSNVIVSACELAEREKLSNLRFINGNVMNLLYYFKENSIARIYLNFSCPFPKNTYANHRLTNAKFLDIYKQILVDGGEVFQKTDNEGFFEYSIEQLSCGGFCLKNISLDLHNSKFENDVMTEYESNFVSLGKRIFRLEAFLKTTKKD